MALQLPRKCGIAALAMHPLPPSTPCLHLLSPFNSAAAGCSPTTTCQLVLARFCWRPPCLRTGRGESLAPLLLLGCGLRHHRPAAWLPLLSATNCRLPGVLACWLTLTLFHVMSRLPGGLTQPSGPAPALRLPLQAAPSPQPASRSSRAARCTAASARPAWWRPATAARRAACRCRRRRRQRRCRGRQPLGPPALQQMCGQLTECSWRGRCMWRWPQRRPPYWSCSPLRQRQRCR